MKIPDDPNAQEAFEVTCRAAWADDYHDDNWAEQPERIQETYRNQMRTSRLKHFMEEGEYNVAVENGKFVCTEGYVFSTMVDQSQNYRIYRCDGGHHYGVVFVEHKERTGETGNTVKLAIKNGELVEESGVERRNDQLELDA